MCVCVRMCVHACVYGRVLVDAQMHTNHSLEVKALVGEEGLHNACCLDPCPEDVLLRWDIVRLGQSVQGTQVAKVRWRGRGRRRGRRGKGGGEREEGRGRRD